MLANFRLSLTILAARKLAVTLSLYQFCNNGNIATLTATQPTTPVQDGNDILRGKAETM
jgi:hypothetical protein